MIRVGLIGAGLIGAKRAQHMGDAKLVAVHDKDVSRSRALAKNYGAQVEENWKTLVGRSDIDAIVVATSHDGLASCSVAALKSGKHVLVEKPGGRNPQEIKLQIQAARAARKVLRVGFNHRFHPGLKKAAELVASKEFGSLLFIRARYGHGGRVGYEKEWRANPKISGGGELLDQGVHLIDLTQWIGGTFNPAWSMTNTFFWPMKVEDYGFVALKSADSKRWAWLHASWVEWKNVFHFEIFCERAKFEISGLGGSYGPEELKCFRMKPEMGPPEVDVFSFPSEDVSWKNEWEDFERAIHGKPETMGARGEDALRTMNIVHWVYAQKKKARRR